jgi:membrane protein implicated in regulation of membrane protease activity
VGSKFALEAFMWRRFWHENARITIRGETLYGFRFVVKSGVSGKIKIFIYEGGSWRLSCECELEYYLDNIDEYDVIIHLCQGIDWVSTTEYITKLDVLRN